MKMIAYRPISLLNTQKIPSVFRLAEKWITPTLLIDEADQKNTGTEEEWIQFINARYDGTPIPRYNTSTGEDDIFKSFGLTCLALRRMPIDEGTTSRMTKINATISPIILDEVAGKEMYDDFIEIRNKLLYLRLKFYNKLNFIGRSGLPVEHSWRGKETLTLVRILEQIDPNIDKDLNEISLALTQREIENLASTWDGIIINAIYDFISEDDVKTEQRADGIYFYFEEEKEEGKKYMYPLTLQSLTKKLNIGASELNRSLTQFKIGIYPRFRLGERSNQRGVLKFKYLEDTDRIFMKYVINYNHILGSLKKTQKLESFNKNNNENNNSDNNNNNINNNDNNINNLYNNIGNNISVPDVPDFNQKNEPKIPKNENYVPDVPDVPPHALSTDDDKYNNNNIYIHGGVIYHGVEHVEHVEQDISDELNQKYYEKHHTATDEQGQKIEREFIKWLDKGNGVELWKFLDSKNKDNGDQLTIEEKKEFLELQKKDQEGADKE